MKKALMILAMGLFVGTIGYTSVAAASTNDQVECEGDHDKKKCKDKDCKKKGCDKKHEGEEKACCSKDKATAQATTTEKKSCSKEGEKKSCCAHKGKK